jgi:hypothetical protein
MEREMKVPMADALYADCETNEERAYFFASGRAWQTGIVAPSVAMDIARAFYALEFAGELTYPPELKDREGW